MFVSLKIFHTTISGKGLWQGILALAYIKTVSCNYRIIQAGKDLQLISKQGRLEAIGLNGLINASIYFWNYKPIFAIQLLVLYSFAC